MIGAFRRACIPLGELDEGGGEQQIIFFHLFTKQFKKVGINGINNMSRVPNQQYIHR